jgi:hypothetical protein
MVPLATVIPAGRTSLRAAFSTAAVVFTLPRVIVSALVVPLAIVAGAKARDTVGATGAACPITTEGVHDATATPARANSRVDNALCRMLIYVNPRDWA